MLGLLIGIAGLVIVVGWIPLVMTGKVIVALILSLLAAMSYGLGGVYTRMKLKNADPLKTATGQLTAAAVLVIPFVTNSYTESVFTFRVTLILLVLAVMCTALGYALYFRLIASIGSTNASLVTLLVPVFSLLWSILFLNEPITPALLIGLALILGSLKLILSSSAKRTEPGSGNTLNSGLSKIILKKLIKQAPARGNVSHHFVCGPPGLIEKKEETLSDLKV